LRYGQSVPDQRNEGHAGKRQSHKPGQLLLDRTAAGVAHLPQDLTEIINQFKRR
jgi:hypothetical protein